MSSGIICGSQGTNRANALAPCGDLAGRMLFCWRTISRGEFFAALFLIACANGLVQRSIQSISEEGLAAAVLSTFDVSVIVLLACCVGITFIFHDRDENISLSDLAVGVPFLVTVALPFDKSSWFAITVLALYILVYTKRLSRRVRGSVILLATSFSMLWSPLLFAFLCKPILDIDAALTAWLRGTPRVGNMVRFADGSGYLVVFPGCSSFANVSLALLTWVLISQAVGHRSSVRDIFWCFAACAAVVAVNVGRLSIMASDMHQFATIHNQWGNSIVNIVILVLTISISALGLRRELLSHV
jgi:hypothetical protein